MSNGYGAADRYRRHERLAAWLRSVADEELLELLSDPRLLDKGHAPVHLQRSNGTVFVKLLPLAALEMQPLHRHSTANIFGLPPYYQYRLGSCGFGAWREVEVHRLANEWVLSGQCMSFPLLHHWRVLPIAHSLEDDRVSLEWWGECPEIRERVSAITEATSSVVLFLEYIPQNLSEWLPDSLRQSSDPAAVVSGLEERLTGLLAFIHGQGLLHLDAHFGNVLTDGSQLYLTDYGLSVSRGFELGADERTFLEDHQSFDLCTAVNSLVHGVVTHYNSNDDWRQTLREMVAGGTGGNQILPDGIRSFLVQRAPLALAIGEFYARLLQDLTTPYPAVAFEELLNARTG